MVPFQNAIQAAKNIEQPAQALIATHEAFNELLYQEHDGPLVLDAPMITALDQARVITEKFVALPAIEDTDYINEVLEGMENAIAAFLKDEIGAEDFWDYSVSLAHLIHYLAGIVNYFEDNALAFGSAEEDSSVSVRLDEDGNIQLYGKLKGGENGLSMEAAQKLQEAFEANIKDPQSTATDLINIAGKLLTGQRFEEAIELLEQIVERFPEERGQCLNTIGACHYYLQNYEEAIKYYMEALEEGEQEERVAYNVWESCEALIEQAADRNEQMKWKFYFEEHFPDSDLKFKV
jgi:tetratricopeptide (TPR) repeat protein